MTGYGGFGGSRLNGAFISKGLLTAFSLGAAAFVYAAITPHIVLNRTSGVVPLAVFADATTTGGLADDDYINANFAWNFDSGGVDPAGKHSPTRGFVAAHVYENPGTYTISLNVTDRFGATAQATAQVVVSAFSGTTYYVASGGNNSAAGTSMTAPLATPDYAFRNKAKPNTRILIRNGDRFTVPGFSVSGGGPVIVGSYSDPDHASGRPPLLFNDENGWGFINFDNGAGDWRFMDLMINAPDNRTFGLGGINILLLRIAIDSTGKDFCTVVNGSGQFVFDCSLRNFGMNGGAGYGLYGDPFNQGAFVGNVSRRQQGGEHLFRTQSGAKMFIAYNDLDSVADVMSGIQIRGSSTQAYLLGNRVVKDCGFHPQNSTSAEHESYCVADGNLFVGAWLQSVARHIAIRNNIFYNGSMSLDVHPLVGMSDSVTIINNTCYCDVGSGNGAINELVGGSATNTVISNNILYTATTYDYAAGISLNNSMSNYRIDNNIYYAPGKGGPLWFTVNGANIGQSGFGAWQAAGADVHGRNVDPKFASTDPSSADFLKLGAGSPGIGGGAATGDDAPVFCDFDGFPRVAGHAADVGARLYTAAGVHRCINHGGKNGASARHGAVVGAYDVRGRSCLLSKLNAARRRPGIIILYQTGSAGGAGHVVMER